MAILLKSTARSALNLKVGGCNGGLYAIACRTKVKDYGYEEGHGEKNEVRKEKWWRKRNPPRKVHEWRTKHNLHPQALAWGPWSQKADWSFDEDGESGVLNRKQQMLFEDDKRLAQEVHSAAILVLQAKQFEKKD